MKVEYLDQIVLAAHWQVMLQLQLKISKYIFLNIEGQGTM